MPNLTDPVFGPSSNKPIDRAHSYILRLPRGWRVSVSSSTSANYHQRIGIYMLPDFSPIAPTGGYLVAPDTDLEFLFTGWHSADGSNWFQNKMREPDIWDNYIDLRTEDADDGDYDDLVIRLRMEMMTNNP